MGGDNPFDSPSRVRHPREVKKNVADDNKAPSSNRRKGRPGSGGKQIKYETEVVGKDSTADTAIISGLKGEKLSGLRSRKSGLSYDEECLKLEVDQGQQQNDSSTHGKEPSELKKNEVDDNKAPSSNRKRGRPVGSGGSKIKNGTEVVEKDSAGDTAIISRLKCKKLSSLSSRNIGLNHDEEDRKLNVDQKQQQNDLSTHEKEPSELKKNVVDDNKAPSSNKKRGRPAGSGGIQIKNDTGVGKDSVVDTAIISTLKCKKLSGLSSRKSGLNYNEECRKLEVDPKQQQNDPSTHEKEPRELKKNAVDDNKTPNSNRKRGRPAGSGCSQIKNDREVVGKDFAEDTAIISSLKCKKLSGLSSRRSGLNHDEGCMKLEVDQKQQQNDWSTHEKESSGGQRTHRRKRGRPQKVLLSSLNAATSDQIANVAKDGVVCDVDSLLASDPILMKCTEGKTPAKVSVLHCSDCKNVSTDTFNTTSAKMAGRNGESSNSQHEKRNSKKDIRRISTAKEISQTQDSILVKMAESACITKEAKMGSKRGCNMFDDQPLSKWFEKLQFSGSSAVEKLHAESLKVKELIKQTHDNNNGTVIASDEVYTQGTAADTESLGALREPELPFVKNTSLWVAVESMEVFRKMPQKPHFRPLLKLKDRSREGFALACMVNFCSAVEGISKLQFDDPKGMMVDILDTLNDLETHGFTVQVLRDQLRGLMSIKENHDQLCAEVDDTNKKVALCNSDRSEQDKVIHETKIQMKKLQEQMANAESIKEMKYREIAALESRRKDAEVAMRRAQSCYEELAASF